MATPASAISFLGVDLRPLQTGRRGGRAEGGDAGALERIHGAGDERRLGSHHDQVGRLAPRRLHDRIDVLGARIHDARILRDAGVARSAEHFACLGGAVERLDDGVLATPASNDEDLHASAGS